MRFFYGFTSKQTSATACYAKWRRHLFVGLMDEVVFKYVFTLDAGLLARSQYSEGPATGHLDTGFSWFSVSISKCWDGSQNSKLPLHASHVALPT